MAGELPVDLRTSRESGGGSSGREAAAAAAAARERPPPEAEETRLPLRKRRWCYAAEDAEDAARGPRAGQGPKEGGQGPRRGCWGLLGNGPPGPQRFPVASYPGEALGSGMMGEAVQPLHIAVVQGNLLVVQRLVALFHQGHRDVDTFNNLRQDLFLCPGVAPATRLASLAPHVHVRNPNRNLCLTCCRFLISVSHKPSRGANRTLSEKCLLASALAGLTPLHMAVGTSNHNVILTLLEHGADVDAVDIKSGRSPLLHAVENNNMEMVELLLKHGANVNAQSYGGNTALHAASGRGFLDMLRLLIRNGADGSLKNYHNDTPLMVAKNKRVIDILRGKASRPGLALDNLQDRSSPANSMASSPGLQTAHSGLLCASPDPCPTTPSPARTPKSQRVGQSPGSANQKPESIISANEPSAPGPLHGVKLERSLTPPTLEQPMGFLGMPKYFLPVTEGMMDPAFHAPLYSFMTSSHNLSPHPLHLLPVSLNQSVIALSPASLASHLHSRGMGTDQSQTLRDSENLPTSSHDRQWLHHRDSGPGSS
ncbi:hypothetical protein JD844_006106 [Phrynosoma platyrhinos]|uniref:BCL3 transcription coactivator n=1 Tax=Phrynosoma platyrhinos TaxID=52577 RepID=A0ABQ7TPD9_PHRPL|nr:hypothetical protein JD844_006106 [Phrynosoma platyrhinos]